MVRRISSFKFASKEIWLLLLAEEEEEEEKQKGLAHMRKSGQ